MLNNFSMIIYMSVIEDKSCFSSDIYPIARIGFDGGRAKATKLFYLF